ncbi:hypothetical protein VUR80DRAFT_7419 [Thermomyces stellatus]
MASKILVAALLASGALGRALQNSRGVASVEARAPTAASRGADALAAPDVKKRSPQRGGGGGGFDFGDYEDQDDFWEEWQTEEAFFAEHGNQFDSEDDFWEQLEAALPSDGGSGGGFSFDDYEDQDDFWEEWQTEEAFFAEHGNQFDSEDDFWEQLEEALPSEEPSGREEEDDEEGSGGFPDFPGFPGFGSGGEEEDGEEGVGGFPDFPGFPGFGRGGGGDGSEEAPDEAPEERVPDPIIVIGPIDD